MTRLLRTAALAVVATALCLAPAAPASSGGTIHDALDLAHKDRASDPAAVEALTKLARDYGTPLYVYDQQSILGQQRSLMSAFAPRFPGLKVFFAVKANSNLAVVSMLHKQGIGAEVVSGGEIMIARKAGVPGDQIMFTSSSKAPWEIDLALKEGSVLNIDSLDELEQIEAAGARLNRTARISFRVNPGVDPHTIHQINTGIEDSKFGLHLTGGIALSAYKRALELPHVKIVGAHCHIGSQITETEGYELTARKMLEFLGELKEKLGIKVEFLDLGGGLGVPYKDGQTVMTPDDLARALEPIWKEGVAKLGYEPHLWLEPGRFFVAPSGFLLCRVNSVKTTPLHTFVNVDAGFETLIRPAMYQAFHRVRVVGGASETAKVEIAGDVCETGDILASDRTLPKVKAGDLVVILDAGAYGFSMASEYNARPLPAEVMVDGNVVRVIRKRGSFEDLMRNQ